MTTSTDSVRLTSWRGIPGLAVVADGQSVRETLPTKEEETNEKGEEQC